MLRNLVVSSITFFLAFQGNSLQAAEESPQVLLIRSDGQSSKFDTIQAAIKAAPPGAVVRIGPGTSQGPVLINKPLTLEGAGADTTFLTADWISYHEILGEGKGVPKESLALFQELQKIAVEKEHGEGPVSAQLWKTYGPKPTLTIRDAKDVIIRGVSISMPGSVKKGGWQGFRMVLIENANSRLEKCALVGSAVDGIEIKETSTVNVKNCLIAGIRSSGIVIDPAAGSTVNIEDCDVRGCGYAGVKISGAGDVTVSKCRISKTAFHGIRYDDTSPTITGNVFSNINRAGIYIDGQTKGMISHNLFLGCSTGGNDDSIINNTFVSRAVSTPAWIDLSAIAGRGTGKQVVRRNVFSGHPHALLLSSTDKRPFTKEGRLFEKNICDTTKSPIVNSYRIEPKSSYKSYSKPEYHDQPLPGGNWQMEVKFTDPKNGDYTLSQDVDWPAPNLGAQNHASLTSPWSVQPAEQKMLDRIKNAK